MGPLAIPAIAVALLLIFASVVIARQDRAERAGLPPRREDT